MPVQLVVAFGERESKGEINSVNIVWFLLLFQKERKAQNEDTLSPRGNFTSAKVNKLLRRFPQITRYV